MNTLVRLSSVLLCALIFVAAQVQAADPAIDAITQAVARPEVLRGQFSQEKQVSGFKNPLRSQGQFVVARQHGVIWTTLKPFPSEVVVTADRILSRQRDGSTRVELDARQQPAMRSVNAIMFALMSGDVQALSSQFNVAASREGQGWRLRLTPKSAMLAKAFQSLTLQGDRYVRQVEIVEANKDRTQIQFSALSEAPATLSAKRHAALSEAVASNAAARLRRWWHWLGIAWLVLLLGLGAQQWHLWSQQSRIDTDILALLPQDAHDRLLSDVTRRIADGSSRQVVVLLGSKDGAAAKRAQAAFAAAMAEDVDHALLVPSGSIEGWFDEARAFYAPYRDRLLTPAQREQLQGSEPGALAEQALAALYGPMGAPRLTDWRQDPLSLWPQWWQQQAQGSGLRLGDDGLLEAEGRHWAVLQFDTPGSAFQLDGERHLDGLLERAGQAARAAAPELEILHAGVPLHAEAAAVQANREINTIGWGSLAAVLLLVWLAFRSLRPILLVAASLLIGCGVALAVTVLVFGKVHVLTLVFGASLVGVAEDYGIHWFASRQAEPADRRWKLLRHLLPGLWLALLTSALAYLALGLAPFRPAPDGAVLGGRPGGRVPHGDLLVPVAGWRRDPQDPFLAVAGQHAGALPAPAGAPAGDGVPRCHRGAFGHRHHPPAQRRRPAQPAVLAAGVDGAADPPEPVAGHAQSGAVLPRAGQRRCAAAAARRGVDRTPACAGRRQAHRRLPRDQ